LSKVWADFAVTGFLLLLAGLLVTRSGEALGMRLGFTESLIGGLLVAVATSLPELVTSLAAVRRGALTLAVANVLGGNTFDTLFAAVADVAYRPGSIYAAVTWRESTMITLTIIMSGVLLLGLLSRERRGPANIGFEGILVLLIYLCGVVVLGSGK
jgi:cation:H+ antiporter